METLSLADLIARIESRGSNVAIRFEPLTYNKFSNPANVPKAAAVIVDRIRAANCCSMATAAMIYSSSWGKFQLMGFNIYADADLSRPIGEFLASPSVQLDAFGAFLKRNGLSNYNPTTLAQDQIARQKFAITYNGSIAYVDQIVAALKYFGISPK